MLLYHKSCGKTGRKLARLLNLQSTKYFTDQTVFIRWGNSLPVPSDYGSINSAPSISLAAHGLKSLVALAEAEVSAPKVYITPPEDLSEYPILGRKIHHRAGTDIVWCETPEDAYISESNFWTKFIPVHKELRVHVFGGMPIRILRKVPRRNDADMRVRTSLRGWGYQRVGNQYYQRGQEVAVRAVDALGLTFGGVDLGWNEETKKYVVFEVNTAPSLNSISLLYYGKEFENYLLEDEPDYEPTGYNWSEMLERATTVDSDTE